MNLGHKLSDRIFSLTTKRSMKTSVHLKESIAGAVFADRDYNAFHAARAVAFKGRAVAIDVDAGVDVTAIEEYAYEVSMTFGADLTLRHLLSVSVSAHHSLAMVMSSFSARSSTSG